MITENIVLNAGTGQFEYQLEAGDSAAEFLLLLSMEFESQENVEQDEVHADLSLQWPNPFSDNVIRKPLLFDGNGTATLTVPVTLKQGEHATVAIMSSRDNGFSYRFRLWTVDLADNADLSGSVTGMPTPVVLGQPVTA